MHRLKEEAQEFLGILLVAALREMLVRAHCESGSL